jgi:hypothetical protein
MKHIFAWVLVLVTFIGVSGCKRTHETVLSDTVSNLKKMVVILQSVKDEASAKAAIPKLQSISKEMKALDEEKKKMGEPSKEVLEELAKKYKDDYLKTLKALNDETDRIRKDEKIMAVLQKPLNELDW